MPDVVYRCCSSRWSWYPPIVVGTGIAFVVWTCKSVLVVRLEPFVGSITVRIAVVVVIVIIIVVVVVVIIFVCVHAIVFVIIVFQCLFLCFFDKLTKSVFDSECVSYGEAASVDRHFLGPLFYLFLGACEFVEAVRFAVRQVRVHA
jgi:hypothetical protein